MTAPTTTTCPARPIRPARRPPRVALPRAEAGRLAEAARGGDREAMARLCEHYEGVALRVARGRRGRYPWIEEDDYYGLARLGLLRAVGRYDSARGAFSTCVGVWVKFSLQRAAATDHHPAPLRVPAWQHNPAARRAAGRRGRDALAAGRKALAARREPLDGPAARAALAGSAGSARADDPTSTVDDRLDLAEALGRLDPRGRRVLAWRFGLGGAAPLTLREVGRRLGVGKERARQVEAAALAELRALLGGGHGGRAAPR